MLQARHGEMRVSSAWAETSGVSRPDNRIRMGGQHLLRSLLESGDD